jgi:hypothetical protein
MGKTKMSKFSFTALLAATAFLMPESLVAEQPPLPSSLSEAIERFAASARVVSTKDVDSIACAPVGETPGVVRADFNGDGFEDYALLLAKETGKETSWQGSILKEARFSFVFFLRSADGKYQPRLVLRDTGFIPTTIVLKLQSAGKVRHRETHKNIQLKYPGVMLSFCEKSATTYYFAGHTVRSIPIAD